MKTKRKRTSARGTAFRVWMRGDASKYIGHCKYDLKPGDRVILCLRVSRRQNRGNLKDQEANLRRRMKMLGVIVIAAYRRVRSGCDPGWLVIPALHAKKVGAKLVAETADRFIRHPYYHSNDNPNLQASENELRDLKFFTFGVPLLTLLAPNASPRKVRSYQRKRGQQGKGRRGGRPPKREPGWKVERRKSCLAWVLELHSDGKSLRSISRITDVPKSTVQDWIAENA